MDSKGTASEGFTLTQPTGVLWFQIHWVSSALLDRLMRYIIPLSILLSTTLACAPKQAADSPSSATSTIDAEMTAALPIDPSIRRGILGNGMQYFIEPNAYPQDRVELRLVVRVGSRQEDPDQLGLAHFLEHMAFNGTANFEAGELVDFLQSKGVSFGAHLNAMTSFDATIYQLSLPTDDEGLVDTGLLILEDWAHGLNLDPEEIEKERGVVLEEWSGPGRWFSDGSAGISPLSGPRLRRALSHWHESRSRTLEHAPWSASTKIGTDRI